MTLRFLLLLAGILLVTEPLTWAHDGNPVKPGPKDKCPVCGMFVAKYPEFVAALTFKNGTCIFFDGVKDLMKYYYNLQKYSSSRKRDDIGKIHVTDFYSMNFIDGYNAFYVSGGDVYGPMGKELIPFEKEIDARAFLKDHKGKAVLRFQEINKEVMKDLD